MKSTQVHRLWLVAVLLLLCQGCRNDSGNSRPSDDLPISRGIQLALHTSGGATALNESIQISDHWQLSSVGRRHGWVRKLTPDEQRELVKILQKFEFLNLAFNDSNDRADITYNLVAVGSGSGTASGKEAREVRQLIEKFVNGTRVAAR